MERRFRETNGLSELETLRSRLEEDLDTISDRRTECTTIVPGASSMIEDYFKGMEDEKPTPTIDLAEDLLDAVRAGNMERLHELIALDVPLSNESHDGTTALHQCAINDNVDMARILLENGASINAKDINGQRAIRVAVDRKSPRVATLLLERDCIFSSIGSARFINCIRKAREEDGDRLIMALKEKLEHSNNGPYPLHFAIHRSLPKTLNRLLEAGYDANAQDQYGKILPRYETIHYTDKNKHSVC